MHATIVIDTNGRPYDVRHYTLIGAEIKALAQQEHGILFKLEGDDRRRIADDEKVHLHDHERF